MAKFSLTIKDSNTDVSVTGDNEQQVLDNIKQLQKLKTKSDVILGFDIKIPNEVQKKMLNLEYSERAMIILYFGEKAMTRADMHERNSILQIKENWWTGSNFTRDMKKKANAGLVNVSKDEKPKYNLTRSGIQKIKEIINLGV